MDMERRWYKARDSRMYVHHVVAHIDSSAEECFLHWEDVENFPRLMRHVRRVEKLGENMSHWEALIGAYPVVWDAVTTNIRPGRAIAWESLDGLRNSGMVHFYTEGDGCRVIVHLAFDPPLGVVGDFLAEHGLNDAFHEQLREDVMNFKAAVEAEGREPGQRAA